MVQIGVGVSWAGGEAAGSLIWGMWGWEGLWGRGRKVIIGMGEWVEEGSCNGDGWDREEASIWWVGEWVGRE